MRWINRNLPIIGVAEKLDLRVSAQGLIHCWHPERHHNGDRTASVGIRAKNNTCKCFGSGCGAGPFGPIDLVKDALGLPSALDGALWIASRFDVPHLARGSHLKHRGRVFRPAGFEGDIGRLVQSGLWAELSAPTRSIVPVLWYFATNEQGRVVYTVTMSYRAIGRYSGVVSANAISRAIRELEEIGWLKRPAAKAVGPIVETSTYVLTPESDDLMELANARAKQMRDEIEAEKQYRKGLKEARRHSLTSQKESAPFTKYRSLYSSDSVTQDCGIPRIAGFRAGQFDSLLAPV